MSLRDVVLPTREIVVSDDASFIVRGIAFADITGIFLKHGPAIALLFNEYIKNGARKIDDDLVKTMVGAAVVQFSDLVSEIIVAAAEEHDQIEKVRRLPVPVQTEALLEIFELTFRTEAELKKFVESIIRLMSGSTKAVTMLQTPRSTNGFGASAGM